MYEKKIISKPGTSLPIGTYEHDKEVGKMLHDIHVSLVGEWFKFAYLEGDSWDARRLYSLSDSGSIEGILFSRPNEALTSIEIYAASESDKVLREMEERVIKGLESDYQNYKHRANTTSHRVLPLFEAHLDAKDKEEVHKVVENILKPYNWESILGQGASPDRIYTVKKGGKIIGLAYMDVWEVKENKAVSIELGISALSDKTLLSISRETKPAFIEQMVKKYSLKPWIKFGSVREEPSDPKDLHYACEYIHRNTVICRSYDTPPAGFDGKHIIYTNSEEIIRNFPNP